MSRREPDQPVPGDGAPGFVRDRTALFFTIVFPLMFLVLFGGIFSDQTASEVDVIQVGSVALFDQIPAGARAGLRRGPST